MQLKLPRRLVPGPAWAVLLGARRLRPARRGTAAREAVALVGELFALGAQLGCLKQGARQHLRRAAALQLSDFEVERGDLLIELDQ